MNEEERRLLHEIHAQVASQGATLQAVAETMKAMAEQQKDDVNTLHQLVSKNRGRIAQIEKNGAKEDGERATRRSFLGAIIVLGAGAVGALVDNLLRLINVPPGG